MEYHHGGDIYGAEKIELDFSVNTSPFGIPESIVQAVTAHSKEWSRYPDSRCRELKEALALFYEKKYGPANQLSPEDFICGNGAADLLYSLIFALRPRRAMLFAPAFGEYERALAAAGCEIEKIVLEEGQDFSMDGLDPALFLRDFDMVILGNPNNPTGTVLPAQILKRWAGFCLDREIFMVIDECFNWFLKDAETYSMTHLLYEYSNVFILNAFTKIYGMAGLRLGYGICSNHGILERMELCRQPWSVSGAAMRAGLQALCEVDFVKMTEEFVTSEREFLADGLKKMGFKVYASKVNYLLLRRPDADATDYDAFCREHGILIRSCENFHGLDDRYYRIAVKLRHENEMLLKCLGQAQTYKR